MTIFLPMFVGQALNIQSAQADSATFVQTKFQQNISCLCIKVISDAKNPAEERLAQSVQERLLGRHLNWGVNL